jgi:hypothetical protein
MKRQKALSGAVCPSFNIRAKHVAVNIISVVEAVFETNEIPKFAFRHAIGNAKEQELMNMLKYVMNPNTVIDSIHKFVGDIGLYIINDENCYGDDPPDLFQGCENFTPDECKLQAITFDCVKKKSRSFNNLRHMRNQLERWLQEVNWCANGLRSVRCHGDSDLDEVLAEFDYLLEDLLHCSDHINNLLISSKQSTTEDDNDSPWMAAQY